jgi:hypothetical protein
MSQHLARVKQYFVLPAGYENASEAQRKQYYEKRCEGYMKLCSMAITSLQPLQIRMLVGLMKATGMVDDMDLQVCKSSLLPCPLISPFLKPYSNDPEVLGDSQRVETGGISEYPFIKQC